MKILQIGVPKSGNFWLYQILQQILKSAGQEKASFIEQHPIQELAKTWDLNYPDQSKIDVIDITDLQVTYRISSIFKMPVEDPAEYLSKTSHVWTHSPVCKKSGGILNLFDKKVYIIRDPRDVLISASKYYCSPYMLKYFPQEEKDPAAFLEKNFENLLKEWVWHVWDHLRLRKEYNLHISFFEGFLHDFQEELSLLLNYLEIELSASERRAIEEAVSFQKLKKKNPKHLKKGKSGYWKDHLTEEQIAKTETIAGPLINFLGYDKDSLTPDRNFPHENFEKLKEKL